MIIANIGTEENQYKVIVSSPNWTKKTKIQILPIKSGEIIKSSSQITPQILEGLEQLTNEILTRFEIDIQEEKNRYHTKTPMLCERGNYMQRNSLATYIETPKTFTLNEVQTRLQLFNGNLKSIEQFYR